MIQSNLNMKLKEIEEENLYESLGNKIPPEDVIAYNELRSCSDLVRMYESKILDIKPSYQRNIVWSSSDKTRFIDSIIKGLPIPSMCFSLDSKIQKWQVIDGLQRMSSIILFLTNDDWVLSKINDIDIKIAGKTVAEIKKNEPIIYKKVENFTLPLTILRCDFNRSDHLEYIFTIFQRLNTGGIKLTNQEIRNALYQGQFNDFLFECDDNYEWKIIIKKDRFNDRDRFQTIEQILRFFAFYDSYLEYKGRLASFLNEYMKKNRRVNFKVINDKRSLFNRVVKLLKSSINKTKPIYKLSNVVLDALLFGVAKNINSLEKREEEVLKLFEKVLKNSSFETKSLLEGTLQRSKVIERLEISKDIFSK